MTNNPVIELFNDESKKFVKICAPMVRYSKLVLILINHCLLIDEYYVKLSRLIYRLIN